MLLECTCGKMYRIRDGATNPPKSCPACGGTLKISGGAPAPAPAPAAPAVDPRVKEFEGRIQSLERDQAASRAAVELKEKELHEAQASIARLGIDLEKAQAAYKDALKKREDRIQELEAEAAKSKGAGAASAQTMQLLRAKDEALREAVEKAAALEQELTDARQGSSSVAGELAEMETKYKEALSSKEAEVEDLQRRLQTAEKQVVESSSKAQHGSEPEAQRLAAKVAGLEKIIQDGENRYRALQKQLEGAGPADKEAQSAAAEKDERIAELQAELAELKSRAPAAPTVPLAPPVSGAKVGEARYLAADLDRGIASISTALAGLASRVRRLHETLEAGEGEEAAAPAPPSEPEAPPDLPAIEPAEPETESIVEEEVAPLETFPLPADRPSDSLPADETLLDMGGSPRPSPSLEDAATPPPEPAPEAVPEEALPDATPGPQKKGFFGKLFGKKGK